MIKSQVPNYEKSVNNLESVPQEMCEWTFQGLGGVEVEKDDVDRKLTKKTFFRKSSMFY